MSDQALEYFPEAAFRGSRTYVHSTDLYEEIVRAITKAGLGFEGPIDFRMKSMIVKRPIYRISRTPEPMPGAAATCAFSDAGARRLISIIETDQPIMLQKAYDESPVAIQAHVQDRSALLSGETGMRPIEAITALAVQMHKIVLPPPPVRRWMLAQLLIRRPLEPSETSRLALTIERLVGTGMTRTRVDAADGPLGSMVFILGKG